MRIPYEDNLPLVKINVIGTSTKEFKTHLDFAATRTLVPTSTAKDLQLEFDSVVQVATASGTIDLPLFRAKIGVFEKIFNTLVLCYDLPEQAPVYALLGRDILDNFEICLNGKKKQITILEPDG